MAATTLIPPKPLDTKETNSLFKKSSKSFNQTQKSVQNISKLLNTRIKVRKQIFSDIFETKRRREFDTRRMEREDEREARRSVPSGTSNVVAAVSKTGGSLIGRLVKALGFIAAGWILRTLPTWIGYAKEFIARVNEIGRIIKSFVINVGNILQSSFRVLTSLKDNILKFDFLDSERKLRNSFTELGNSIEGLQKDFKDTIDVFTTDITKEIDGIKVGSYSGEEIPEPGEGFTEDAASQTQTYSSDYSGSSSSGTGGSSGKFGPATNALLDAIAYAEGTAGHPNNGYLTHFTGAQYSGKGYPEKHPDKVFHSKDYSSAAFGRYQFMPGTWNTVGGGAMTPERQDAAAVQLILRRLKLNSPEELENLLQKQGISPQISSKLSPEWASFPTLSGNSYYGQPVKKLEGIQQRYQQSLQRQRTQTSPTGTTGTPTSISTGTMKLIPQTGAGGFVQGGSGSEGEAQYATHFHIDAKTANPSKEELANIREVSFQAVMAMHARGSTVWFGNLDQYASKDPGILRNQIAAEQRAHDSRSSAAVDIQETNPNVKRTFPSQPGSATKFPFAVGEVYFRGGYGREAEIIGSRGITVSHGATGSSASKISTEKERQSTPQAQISSAPTQQRQQAVAQQITPERKGQDISVVVPSSQQPQQSVASSGGSSQQSSGPSMGELLNNFMKQKFLLDLSYL